VGRAGTAAEPDGGHAGPTALDRAPVARDPLARIGRRNAGGALGLAALTRWPDAAMGTRRAAHRAAPGDRAGDRRIGRGLDAQARALDAGTAGAGTLAAVGAGLQRHHRGAAADFGGEHRPDRGVPAGGAADA